MQHNQAIARLMAIENLRVEHKNMSTAAFDVANRVLYLPIWKDMSPELYDMLRAHEIGHALETPLDGWHGTVYKNPALRSFLNVVEDARIERMIKSRYPGVRPSFVRGYKELLDRGFFGHVDFNNTDDLLLVDRINLHFKVGNYFQINFTESEQKIVKRIELCETWEDVVALAQEIFDLDKEDLKKQQQEEEQESLGFGDGEPGDGQEGQGQQGDAKDGNNDSDDTSNGPLGGTDQDDMDLDREELPELRDYTVNPRSYTDENFRNREHELIDHNALPWVYVNLPKVETPKNLIVPYKQVLFEFIATRPGSVAGDAEFLQLEQQMNFQQYLDRFEMDNKKLVEHLCREFEIRRNARQLARAATSKTGELNLKKLHQHKLTDDIFQRLTVVPKGKSHGFVLIFDQSGSMADGNTYTYSIQQIVLLTMFCRRINIPFEVYGFTSNTDHIGSYAKPQVREFYGRRDATPFSNNVGDIAVFGSGFRLRQYLSSTMSTRDYKQAVRNMQLIAVAMAGGYNPETNSFGLRYGYSRGGGMSYMPSSERLQSTPLNQAIMGMNYVLRAFKEQTRVDIVNAIYLTDGDADAIDQVWQLSPDLNSPNAKRHVLWDYGIKARNYKLVVRDPETGHEVSVIQSTNRRDNWNNNRLTDALLSLVGQNTGARNIGYFIARSGKNKPSGNLLRTAKAKSLALNGTETMYYDIPRLSVEAEMREVNQVGYLTTQTPGYRKHFWVPSFNMAMKTFVEDQEDGDTYQDVSKIRKNFMKNHMDRRKSRVLLSHFIQEIA
jgi:hypothetical protein